jgi:hypothetical protein
MDAMDQAIIRLTRNEGAWRDRFRRYLVLVDDEVVGKIKRGDTADYVVEPWSHSLRLKIDWKGSDTLHVPVRRGHVARFVCGPNGKATTASVDVFRKKKTWIALAKE